MIKISKHGSRRRFSEEFKSQRVREYEKGMFTVKEISRKYKVSVNAVYKWLRKYSYFYQNNLIIVEENQSNSKKLEDAENRIKELERKLGVKQISIDYLEALIKVAGEEYEVDLKKSLNTKVLKG